MSAALDQVRSRISPQGGLAAVQLRWADLVGPSIASVTEPVSERNGVLRVECQDSIWVEELTFMESELTARIREEMPESAPDSIKFVNKRR